MSQAVTDSQFYMWRTLFAVAHADDIVTDEELRFMAEALEDIPFSEEQRAILNGDVRDPQDIEHMFSKVSDPADQASFFDLARELVHIDGDYGVEEQDVMLKLKELHLQSVNVDDLVGGVSLELEDTSGPIFTNTEQKKGFKDALYSYRDAFLGQRFDEDK